MAEGAMRLDRFLWHTRIVKTRAIAQRVAQSGHLRIDGQPADKSAAPVRVGSVLAFASPTGRVRAIRVASLPTRRGPPEEARACYVDLLADQSAAPPPANVSQQQGR